MLVVPFACAEFHDKSGNVIHRIHAHELRNITEVPDAIVQDPLYALMVEEGSLKAPESKLDLKALEKDPDAVIAKSEEPAKNAKTAKAVKTEKTETAAGTGQTGKDDCDGGSESWRRAERYEVMALTSEAFLAFYPQFSTFAEGLVLPEYLRQANARFSDFGSDAEEARRLFTAHKLTLYAASCLPEGVSDATAAQIASAGKGSMQEIASKKVGDVSISYATSTSTSNGSSTGLNDLNQTVYGLQLLSLLRLYGFARYIP